MWKFKFTLTLSLIFTVMAVFAQTEKIAKIEYMPMIEFGSLEFTDSIPLPLHPDSITTYSVDYSKYKIPTPLITAVDVSFDYLNLYTYAVDNRQRIEYGAGIMLKNRLYLSGSKGSTYHATERAYRNALTENTGNFYRFGADYKMEITPTAWFYLGVRYGMATFDSEINYTNTNPLFEDDQGQFAKQNMQATWYEIVMTSEQEFFKNVWIGWNLRAKRPRFYDNYDELVEVNYIPGYGNTAGNWSLDLNLFIRNRLPLKLF